jgi:hypothetical protein
VIVSRILFSRKIRGAATFDFCNSIGPLRHLVRRSDPVADGGKADIAQTHQIGRLRPKADRA